MSDNPNLGYYGPSSGSITGIEAFNVPRDNPNIADTGWSIEQLRRYLENQSDVNFPSSQWLQEIEQRIQNHINDLDNPHQTTLNQIVSDIVAQIIGSVVPGTPPSVSPFYSFDAVSNLPLGTVIPASYNTQNLYRRTETGDIINAQTEQDKFGTDTTGGVVGIPLYSNIVNITPANWNTLPATPLNTTLAVNNDSLVVYPFTFRDVEETPALAQFGINIPMTQNLQTAYTTCFYIRPSAAGGSVKICQPSDTANYILVNLEDGVASFFTDTMGGTSVRYPDGTIRISITFTSSASLPDDALCVIHLNPNQPGSGIRQGSLGRKLFSIAEPQTTRATLNFPTLVDEAQSGTCPLLQLNMGSLGVPAAVSSVLFTFSIDIHPTPQITPIIDATILTFDELVISRDQTRVVLAVAGNILFTSDILDGLNTFSVSYSNNKIIFKDIASVRQEVLGTFPTLSTASVSFGPFGGYLLNAAFYNQTDDTSVLEYLSNG